MASEAARGRLAHKPTALNVAIGEVQEAVEDYVEYLGNEPSLGLYYIQEHTRTMVPVLADFERSLAAERRALEGVEQDVRLTMPVIEGMARSGFPSVALLMRQAQQATELARRLRQARRRSSSRLPGLSLFSSSPTPPTREHSATPRRAATASPAHASHSVESTGRSSARARTPTPRAPGTPASAGLTRQRDERTAAQQQGGAGAGAAPRATTTNSVAGAPSAAAAASAGERTAPPSHTRTPSGEELIEDYFSTPR
mmetsp:Transcript_11933/g.43644  ORF Transcript_11933/g.43644 Transcript_11933/m.43644 type:complete len:256 (+) Transcript_11933:175-942(+)